MDLYTISCGPSKLDLPVLSGSEVVGRAYATIEMTETRQLVVSHKDFKMDVDVDGGVRGRTTLRVVYRADPAQAIAVAFAQPFVSRAFPELAKVRFRSLLVYSFI